MELTVKNILENVENLFIESLKSYFIALIAKKQEDSEYHKNYASAYRSVLKNVLGYSETKIDEIIVSTKSTIQNR